MLHAFQSSRRDNIVLLRQMINAAWEWARERNLLRTNAIHKEEEAKLILTEDFHLNSETGAETSMSGTIEAEDSMCLGSG